MSRIKVISIITVLIVALSGYVIFKTTLFKTPLIGFYGAQLSDYTVITDIFKNGYNIIEYDKNAELFSQFIEKPCDLLITKHFKVDKKWSEKLKPISGNISSTQPYSTRKISEFNNVAYLIPLQYDHIELAYKQDVFSKEIRHNGLIFSFSELEAELKRLTKPNNYPLAIAGGIDSDLMDFISVLAISSSGVDGYNKLSQLLKSDADFDKILNSPLNNDFMFKDILDIAVSWKKEGVLHPQWLDLDQDDVNAFLENEISSSVVTRLSTHRTMPLDILRSLNETPFPFLLKEDRGSGLVLPVDSLAINRKSLFGKQIGALLPKLLSDKTQKDLTSFSRLAPTISTSEAVDKQASDVRLWGAASSSILQQLTTDSLKQLKSIRGYLQQ